MSAVVYSGYVCYGLHVLHITNELCRMTRPSTLYCEFYLFNNNFSHRRSWLEVCSLVSGTDLIKNLLTWLKLPKKGLQFPWPSYFRTEEGRFSRLLLLIRLYDWARYVVWVRARYCSSRELCSSFWFCSYARASKFSSWFFCIVLFIKQLDSWLR